MRSKRLLAMLLSLCLVLSCLAPTAMAVEAPADSAIHAEKNNEASDATEKQTSNPFANGLIASVTEDQKNDPITMRDSLISKLEESAQAEGDWVVSPAVDPDLDLLVSDVPDCLEELKKAAEYYSASDVVAAFVVMEEAPLAESYKTRSLVSASAERALIQKQDAVISSIEKTVLNGEKLDVRYQFTYLTNAFSIETNFENLEKIAMIKGVDSVFIMPVYTPAAANPNTAAAGAMTGVHTVWESLGYTGEGMKIAIIDTGLDLDHPSFEALNAEMVEGNENYLSVEDVAEVLEQLNAYKYRASVTADALYRNTKVPFAFNYCDANLTADHSADLQGDHGTHVAGIAAANRIEGTKVVGMAPDAQIIVMKVFGNNGGAYADDIVAALEDAMILGCDVVNASLGSPAGFSTLIPEIDRIYERLAYQNIIATISAGNEGTSSYDNLWGTDLNNTKNPDNATVGSPSTYANSFSIASAENCEVQTPYFTLADGTKVFFNNVTRGFQYGYTPGMEPLIGEELEFVVIDGMGNAEDFYDAEGNSLVEGKVAVVFRGVIDFGMKIINAENAGAVGCIIANNTTDDIFNIMMIDSLTDEDGNEFYPSIPSCLISLEDGLKMADYETKTMCVSETTAARVVEGGQMSSFSSWGVAPDLRLLPDITGIGGNVYSCYDGGEYGVMSGTSMSAPQVAGVSALVMQYLYSKYPDQIDVNDGFISDMARAILMSTAKPIISTDSGVEASPRQQGSGLVDAAAAVKTKAFLTVNGGRPKAELFDKVSGKYTFTFEINNISNATETFILSSSLLTEDFIDYGVGEYFMAGYDVALTGDVSFSINDLAPASADEEFKVTVPGGETVEVTVTITLSDEDKAMFARYWENGGYVEGFIYLENADEYGVDLSLPFLGFYGDWTQPPVFDSAYWYENSFWSLYPENGLADGDEYYHVLWTSLAGTDYVLGFNPYSGPYADHYGNIVYDPANNSVSPNGDGVVDGIDEIYLSLLRNAKTLTFTYSVDGQVIHRETVQNAAKTMYLSNYGQVIPWLYSWYGDDMFDFSTLENNTQVLLTIEAKADYGLGGNNMIEIPITVDTEAPALLDAYQVTEADGSHSLVIITNDNVNVAAMFLMNRSGSRVYAEEYAFDAREDGTYLATFNVDELGTELMVALCDYAGNEGYYNITYTAAGNNVPDMSDYEGELFAYRLFDNYIYSDHMYGWVSLTKPAEGENAELSVWTDDYMEYAAINAAEYVSGKIFAVDAVHNLIVMDAGLFDRKTITNLGVNVLDMTFDDSTDTMYVLTKDEDDYVYLQTMDLLTGALNSLSYMGEYDNAPWAITDDDNGNLYAMKPYSPNIYTLVEGRWNWSMAEVTDANGDKIVITDANGDPVDPSAFTMSMTYLDGKIYWGYYHYNWLGGTAALVTIDTADWSSYCSDYAALAYDSNGNLISYNPATELCGLLSLTETDYEIPASDAAEELVLDSNQVILGLNSYQDLSVSWLPWNYALDESQLVWSSEDESIATVADGRITSVSEGITYVTVSYGELSATCQVVVVETTGTFNAYNYYTGDGYYGYMTTVDMEIMDYILLTEEMSPVDFVAGDFNGHDGYFYGYDMGGQLYRYDIANNEATPLGASMGTYPVDMAYDYSTGMMYMMTLDQMTYQNVLYAVNMSNGSLMKMAEGSGLLTLACATDGTLYAMDASGYACMIMIEDYSSSGMGMQMSAMPVLEEPFGELYFLQSMCWDHNNNVLLWNWCEAATMMWIDPINGYSVNLGDHTESGLLELTGMHVIPDEIPELPEIPVASVSVEDMLILTGYEKVPAVTVAPFNATCQSVEVAIEDTDIVELTEAGTLKGLSAGTTTVTVFLEDTVGEESFERTFTVTVMDGADNMYAHLLTDVATYNSQAWIELFPGNPGQYETVSYFDYTIFTAEHVDGKIYTYGYDANDWTANWQFFILDEENHAIQTQIDMGKAFPYVYDMTYDYVTATMYVLAGASEDNTELYIANMETGELTLLQKTDPLFLAIAAGPEGELYLIENSQEIVDEWDPWAAPVVTNANLWVMDPLAGTLELVGDTGIQSNMISSMAYDYDTGSLYWTPFAQASSYISHLAIVDTETGLATSLGTIGIAGAQVGGLHILCDEYPETDTSALYNMMLSSMVVATGDSASMGLTMIPGGLDAELVWTSSDETIVTVDEDGVVTGVSQGAATITVTATYNGTSKTASAKVAVLDTDAGFLTWNSTDMGWSLINRWDYTELSNLTEGETLGVQVIASVGDDVYGYDENNQLFKLNTETFERTLIGDPIENEEETLFVIKDLAYDAANDRMLLLGDTLGWDDYYEVYSEFVGSCALYTVDLTTGALEELYVFAEYTYVYGMSVGNEGEIYFYSVFDDGVDLLDLTTGTISRVVTLQSQSIYGDIECDYTLHFDPMTDTLYLLFTSNNRFYKMLTIDAVTGSLADNGYVGEITEVDWAYYGDIVAGLTFVDAIKKPTVSFTDVTDPTAFYYEPVAWAVENGITTGTTSTTFSPNDICGRAQIVTFLWRAAGQPEPETAVNPFVDVKESDFFYKAVLWAVENGITNGVDDTHFDPTGECTRAQAVTFLWRAAGKPMASTTSSFTDVPSGAYYYDAVNWAVENEITNGMGDSAFQPDTACTRGQIITFLYRYMN